MDSFHDITAGLRERIYIIHRRRWVLITVVVIIFTVTAIGNFAATPLYQAYSRIRIEPQMPDVVPFQDHRAISSGRQLDYYNTQYRMLKSPSLAKMVRENLPAEAAEDLSPARLLSMVEIKPITQSELVDIVAIGPDPELAALVANTWADQFIRKSIQAKFESVQTALSQLNRQLEEQNQKVLDAQAELMDYKEKERIISLENVEKQLSQLSEDYSAIRQQAEEKELQLQHLARYQGQDLSLENFPQVRYHSIILQLRNRLVQLQATRGEFSQRYRERHPRMIQLEAEIATVEAALQEEIGKIVEGLKRERDLARDQEEILRRDLEKQKTLFFTMERKIKNIEGLSAKVDIDREVQQALLSRVSEATMTKGIEITNIRVVDYGEVPRQPFKPRKTFNLILSLIIGTGGGVAAIFFLENLDTSVKTAGEAKKILKIPFLGAIPLYSQVNTRNDLSPLEIMKNPMGLIPEAYR
ncbi:MAG: GumC family protein, partial [Candidatus Erginobacter occultus]|nr:GumC family protein [Candidatus Erginobacter occultus]